MNLAIGIVLKSGQITLIDWEDRWLAGIGWTLRGHYVRRSDMRQLNYVLRGENALHRLITKATKGQIVDHINGDVLDNRRSNLRIATPTENARNIGPQQQDSPAGAIGVGWNKARRKWQASIRVDGRLYHLGLFKDVEEAKQARAAAELRLWGAQPRRAETLAECLGEQIQVDRV